MRFSFLAKQARTQGKEDDAIEAYIKAAEFESSVADYYFDKPELEPTRSIIIRSAAFLNLKAGNIDISEKYIFWGLVNTQDLAVREQLYEALELCIAFKKLQPKEVSGNVDYIYRLRQKSVLYSIEPKNKQYSSAVTLEMIADFSESYTKSIKAFAKSKFKKSAIVKVISVDDEEDHADEFQKLINPVLTAAGFGSFKFAVATDILGRIGEVPEITKLKSNILLNYHDEVFSKDFNQQTIAQFRQEYSKEELDDIFRPVINMRTSKADYRISYLDRDSLTTKLVSRIGQKEKKELLPPKTIQPTDIGFLESVIAHTRQTDQGSSRKVILKQDLTSYTFSYPTRYIESKIADPIILNNEISITVNFNNQVGFVLSIEELPIQVVSDTFNEGLSKFYDALVRFILDVTSKKEPTDQDLQYLSFANKFLGDTNALPPNQ